MNFDRNTVIGFVLLAVLLFVYLFTSTRSSQELAAIEQKKQDSLARIAKISESTTAVKADSLEKTVPLNDSLPGFKKMGVESLLVAENNLLKITFSNKGGQPRKVELKRYRSLDSTPVILGGSDFDKISFTSSKSKSFLKLTFTLSECPPFTGTLTAVAVILKS